LAEPSPDLTVIVSRWKGRHLAATS
jgi:hypothetical protein